MSKYAHANGVTHQSLMRTIGQIVKSCYEEPEQEDDVVSLDADDDGLEASLDDTLCNTKKGTPSKGKA